MRRLRAVHAGAMAVLAALFGVLGAVGLVGVAGAVLAPSACACSCARVSDEEALAAADVVFEGRLVQTPRTPSGTWNSGQQSDYVFTVSRVYKGQAVASQVVESPFAGGSCGIELPLNSAVVVFAQFDEAGRLTSGLCSGNRVGSAPAAWGAGTAPADAAEASTPAGASPSTIAPGPGTVDPDAADEQSTKVVVGALAVLAVSAAAVLVVVLLAVRKGRREARSTVGP